jgi:hypothetical protein
VSRFARQGDRASRSWASGHRRWPTSFFTPEEVHLSRQRERLLFGMFADLGE